MKRLLYILLLFSLGVNAQRMTVPESTYLSKKAIYDTLESKGNIALVSTRKNKVDTTVYEKVYYVDERRLDITKQKYLSNIADGVIMEDVQMVITILTSETDNLINTSSFGDSIKNKAIPTIDEYMYEHGGKYEIGDTTYYVNHNWTGRQLTWIETYNFINLHSSCRLLSIQELKRKIKGDDYDKVSVKSTQPKSVKITSGYEGEITPIDPYKGLMPEIDHGKLLAFGSPFGSAFWAFDIAPTGNLLGWWPLNENATDSIGSNDGTLNGSPSSAGDHSQRANKGYRLNGTNQYMEVVSSDFDFGTESFTVSWWTRPFSVAGQQTMMYKGSNAESSSDEYYHAHLNTNTVHFNIGDGTTSAGANPAKVIETKGWYFIVYEVNRDRDLLNVYINGKREGGVSISSIGDISSANDLLFGTREDGNQDYDGTMDEIKFYQDTLGADSVLIKYYERTPDNSDLEIHYLHNESVTDWTDNGYDGTDQGVSDRQDIFTSDNHAYDYKGLIDHTNTNHNFQTTMRNDFSVSFTCQPQDGQPSSNEWFVGTTSTDNGDEFRVCLKTDGKIEVYYEANTTSNTTLTDAAVFTNGVQSWTHVLVIMDDDSTKAQIFVDGSKVAASKTAGTDLSSITWSGYTQNRDLFIGANNVGFPQGYMDSFWDDFRIYNIALDPDSNPDSYYDNDAQSLWKNVR